MDNLFIFKNNKNISSEPSIRIVSPINFHHNKLETCIIYFTNQFMKQFNNFTKRRNSYLFDT